MSEPAPPLLQVRGLCRRYDQGAVRALDDVSFDAAAGQTLALIGPSGCGKTTLLSLLGLLERPDAGEIRFDGMPYAQVRNGSRFRARHIGFVFQFHHLLPAMTLLENVQAPLLPLGVPRPQRRERAARMLESMGLQQRMDFLPARVSGGERQRAAVARALVSEPALVLADEPTGNLDSASSSRVVELLLRHARERNALVVLATHNPEIAATADRRLELLDGRRVDAAPMGSP